MTKRKIIFLGGLVLGFVSSVHSQHVSTEGEKVICYANYETNRTYVAPDADFTKLINSNNSGRITEVNSFEIDFFNVPVAGQTTIRYAAEIWAAVINSEIPIKISITWEELGDGVLGSARPASREARFDGAPVRSVWYPIALAERLARKELNEEDEYEIIISLNQEFNWYFGTDGSVAENTHDLLSVALHEIGHGLGLSDTFTSSGGDGSWGWNARANIYDVFIQNNNGLQLIDPENFKNFSTALHNQITSGNLEYASLTACELSENTFPIIYAPAEFDSGSSISHLDEKTYPAGDTNSLMSPQLSKEEAIHNTGPLVNAMLADMGYVYTFIEPDSIGDQPDWNAEILITGTVRSDSILLADSSFLTYSYDEFATTSGQVPMEFNTEQTEFTAIIPAAGFKTFVEFYTEVTDNNRITYRSPATEFEDNYRFGLGLITGIEDELLSGSFSVYPNPSSGRINIQYSSNIPGNKVGLQVRDLRGKLIHKESLTMNNGMIEISLDLQNSPAGMYVAELVSRSGSTRKSFVIR
jgi:type IX secretion system substrate protein